MQLKGSKTAASLRRAFTAEAEQAVRLLYFARRADVEGRADAAQLLRSLADGEIGQAFGHLELLEETEDPLTGTGETEGNLEAVIASELEAAERGYPGRATAAREEGQGAIAEWFEAAAQAEQAHLRQLRRLRGQR
jgi:rubrerythrin